MKTNFKSFLPVRDTARAFFTSWITDSSAPRGLQKPRPHSPDRDNCFV